VSDTKPTPTLWHRILAALLANLLTPVHITVQTDVPLMTDPPEADILLLRREGDHWTQAQKERLPDGIRDSQAGHILIEFKATESLNRDKLIQILAYGYFYRQTQKLNEKDVLRVLLVARRPRASTLNKFGFALGAWPGVYQSDNVMLTSLILIVLAELDNETHNAFVKCFATQKKAKVQAFQTLETTSFGLVEATVVTFLLGLRQALFKGEMAMSNELTPEKVMEMGEKWIDLVLATLPPEEVLEHYRPEDILRQYRPEERLKGLQPEERLRGLQPEEVLRQYRPEQRLEGLTLEEIEAYLQQRKKRQKPTNGEQKVEA
jgi:hypothetical protein